MCEHFGVTPSHVPLVRIDQDSQVESALFTACAAVVCKPFVVGQQNHSELTDPTVQRSSHQTGIPVGTGMLLSSRAEKCILF